MFTIKCWNVLMYVRSTDLKWFHINSRIRQWVRRHIYIIWLTRMVLPLIPLMGKRTFQTFLQVLVVRSVALKREFISIPRWQQLSDDGISSSPICQLYIRCFSRGFSENCNMYDLFCINAETPFSWIFTANIEHAL